MQTQYNASAADPAFTMVLLRAYNKIVSGTKIVHPT